MLLFVGLGLRLLALLAPCSLCPEPVRRAYQAAFALAHQVVHLALCEVPGLVVTTCTE